MNEARRDQFMMHGSKKEDSEHQQVGCLMRRKR